MKAMTGLGRGSVFRLFMEEEEKAGIMRETGDIGDIGLLRTLFCVRKLDKETDKSVEVRS